MRGMAHLKRLLAACCALGAFTLGCGLAAPAATNARGSFPAIRAATPPALDARLADPVWKTALVATDLMGVTTHAPSRVETRFSLLYDDANLYVGIVAEQRGFPITATQTANNVGFGVDDYAGIGIDPTGNGQQVYFFETTPLGTRYQQATESARYAPPWTATAARTATGWSAMLVIPLKVVRQAGLKQWRFDFIRHIAAVNENQSWAYDAQMNDGGGNGGFPQSGDVRFWPRLTDIILARSAAKRKPALELYGLTSAGSDRREFAQSSGAFSPVDVRHTGVDLTYPITGTISLVGALAPDFSNVEIDQQTIAPQEFRRSLAEYRPFFSQGANFFAPISGVSINSPPNLNFYSPNIGSFTRGLKSEGTFGNQSFGVLETRGAGFDDDVLSYKHSLPNRSFNYQATGVFTHHEAGNETFDQRAGNDATIDFVVTGRDDKTGFVYSGSYGAERGSFIAQPSLARKTEDFLDFHKPNYEVFVGYKDIGPSWNPVDGFTTIQDIRGPIAFVDMEGTLAPNGPFKRVGLFGYGDRFLDRSGAVHESDAGINLDVTTKNLIHLNLGPSVGVLRSYNGSLVGYPTYTGGVNQYYNSNGIGVGYRDGTPNPIDAGYSYGVFSNFFLQQVSFSTSRSIATRYTIGLEYDGTLEKFATGAVDGQSLRRVSFGETIGKDTNLSLSLRDISGRGGFASPGINLAGSFHRRFKNDSELFINYGTPAANSTLQRFVLKYVLRLGGGAGV